MLSRLANRMVGTKTEDARISADDACLTEVQKNLPIPLLFLFNLDIILYSFFSLLSSLITAYS